VSVYALRLTKRTYTVATTNSNGRAAR
jgi:hypothetical protein